MSANGNGGFMSIVNQFIPIRSSCSNPRSNMSSRTISTQTEESDPVILKGNVYSYMLVQELALHHPVRGKDKDDIYQTLFYYVCEIMEKHRANFNGIMSRVEVTHYDAFASIANELFEANANEPGQLRITWGRILSLFAFAVRLAQECQESPERVNYVTTYLDTYLSKHIIPFVRSSGGWGNLVQHFPPIGTGEGHLKRAILWSGLCVGLVATMYVSTFLR